MSELKHSKIWRLQYLEGMHVSGVYSRYMEIEIVGGVFIHMILVFIFEEIEDIYG